MNSKNTLKAVPATVATWPERHEKNSSDWANRKLAKGSWAKLSKTGRSLVNSPTTWNRIAALVAGRRCWTCLWRLAELEERYKGAFSRNDAKNPKHPCTSLYSDMTWNPPPLAFPQCWDNCLFSDAIAMQMWPLESQCVVGLNLPRRNRHRKSPFQSLLDYASGLWRFLQAQPTLRLLYTSEVNLQTFSSVCRPHDNGAKVLHGAFKPYDCMVDAKKRTWNDSI